MCQLICEISQLPKANAPTVLSLGFWAYVFHVNLMISQSSFSTGVYSACKNR